MYHLLAVQVKRLFYSKLFYISLLIGSAITIAQYIQMTTIIFSSEKMVKSIIPDSTYLLWLNINLSELTNLFFMLLPILAVLPFSIQLLVDKKTNYSQFMIMKSGKYTYLFSMIIVSSISGFLVIFLPILINFFLFSLTFPAISPSPFIYYMYGLDWFDTLFYELHLSYPLIHALFYIFLSGLIGSLFAALATTLCLFFRYTLIILTIPLIINLITSLLSEFFEIGISPMLFLNMTSSVPIYLWSTLMFCCFMIVCTLILLSIGVRRLEN